MSKYLFTCEQVGLMLNHGILPEDSRVELVDGRLFEMPTQSPLQASTVDHAAALLRTYYPNELVRQRKPLLMTAISAPQPDMAVVRGDAKRYMEKHPDGMCAVLVAEVAVTGLKLARLRAEIYARGAVAVYWILDAASKQLEVHTEPHTLSQRYTRKTTLSQREMVPLPFTEQSLLVRDLFIG
jgi:Uma2 family endonuclease